MCRSHSPGRVVCREVLQRPNRVVDSVRDVSLLKYGRDFSGKKKGPRGAAQIREVLNVPT
jgi:hypothetical protein